MVGLETLDYCPEGRRFSNPTTEEEAVNRYRFSNQRRIRQRKETDMLCVLYALPKMLLVSNHTLTAPSVTRIWET